MAKELGRVNRLTQTVHLYLLGVVAEAEAEVVPLWADDDEEDDEEDDNGGWAPMMLLLLFIEWRWRR